MIPAITVTAIEALLTALVALTLFAPSFAQTFPGKIRGYKVHNVIITAANTSADPDGRADVAIGFGEPRLSDIGLTRALIEADATFTARRHSGQIEFLTFRDFTANGVPIEIEEYGGPLSFKKRSAVSLGKPVVASIRFTSAARAVFGQLQDKSDEWSITGTVLAFGKFKKFGFNFKRVIPIKVELKINDPLRSLAR